MRGRDERSARLDRAGAAVVQQHEQSRHAREFLDPAVVLAAEARHVAAGQHRKADDRHQHVAAVRIAFEVDELVDVVALRNAAVAVEVFVEEARDHHRGMQVQVATDLPAAIRDATAQQQVR